MNREKAGRQPIKDFVRRNAPLVMLSGLTLAVGATGIACKSSESGKDIPAAGQAAPVPGQAGSEPIPTPIPLTTEEKADQIIRDREAQTRISRQLEQKACDTAAQLAEERVRYDNLKRIAELADQPTPKAPNPCKDAESTEQPKPTPTSVSNVPSYATPTPEAPRQGPRIISGAGEFYQVVAEHDGRIWQNKIYPGHPSYSVAFNMPASVNMNRTFKGINATLMEDTNRDGTPDRTIASNVNNYLLTLNPDGRYVIVGGPLNGGFELAPTAIPFPPAGYPTPTPEAPRQGPRIISDRIDSYKVVVGSDGRIWQPDINEGDGKPYTLSFVVPQNFDPKRTYYLDAINAEIWANRHDNELIWDTLLGYGSNDWKIQLIPGEKIMVKGIGHNSGFEIRPEKNRS